MHEQTKRNGRETAQNASRDKNYVFFADRSSSLFNHEKKGNVLTVKETVYSNTKIVALLAGVDPDGLLRSQTCLHLTAMLAEAALY